MLCSEVYEMVRQRFPIGSLVCQKQGTNPYWADGLIEGEVVEDKGGVSVRVRIMKIKSNPGRCRVGLTYWLERDCIEILNQSKPCKLTFSWE